jgi:hypothetical protein
MIMQRSIRNAALATGILASALLVDGWLPIGVAIKNAEARVGRPATPASVAGVARRTTRRTIRRTSVYAATLPRGCRAVVIDGTRLHQCGGTYYQAAGNRYVVVRVD